MISEQKEYRESEKYRESEEIVLLNNHIMKDGYKINKRDFSQQTIQCVQKIIDKILHANIFFFLVDPDLQMIEKIVLIIF